ncbi:S41 family peptidase [Micromonospora sp. HM5-17]|jgi:carboxyl-terminal processing protease|uniref:S41 family peptidase n=1 Tax=Micromonospora sp. HM5-17 TaxID=2487710 RepID=UPI0013155A91|nr:S41 family peptidase [Micromonospora sp. HM5-17]
MSDNGPSAERDPRPSPVRRDRRTRVRRRLLAGGAVAVLVAAGLLAYPRLSATDPTAGEPAARPAAGCTSPSPSDRVPERTPREDSGQHRPAEESGRPAPAGEPAEPRPHELKPTTVTTIGQAYYCILDSYYRGPLLDSRSLLVPAFAALTQELQRRGLDQPQAALPALTGGKDQDWAAFRQVYDQITDRLPPDAAVRQAVAEATLRAMVESLDDNHATWRRSPRRNTTGIEVSAHTGPGHVDPTATPPLFVTRVAPDSPADRAHVRPGDEVLAVNGVPPYVNGVLAEGALDWITSSPEGTRLTLELRRPATGATVTTTVTARATEPAPRPRVEARPLDDGLGYVRLPAFAPGLADQVLEAIADLRKTADLRGIVLDLRGNGGGSPREVSRLLGALAPGRIFSYWCDVRDHCIPNRGDEGVAALDLPLAVLTDRGCASACDSFSSAVKDLGLGTLVGTRTAGAVAGPGELYPLDDGSLLSLPRYHEIAANREVIDTIGVAPDHHVPLTSADLSAGRDPGLRTARKLLTD